MKQRKEMQVLWKRVSAITNALDEYWPLTLRQIYYQLVAAGDIENRYKMLSTQLTKMRNQGRLSWAVMEDRTRRAVEKLRWENQDDFVRQQLRKFLTGYQRCLIQQQEKHVELWVEKDALSSIFERVGIPYCVTIVTCKGHLSTTFLNDYAERVSIAEVMGKESVIIYGGDLDPSGIQIPKSIQQRLLENYDLHVEIDRFALTMEQVEKYNLPQSIDAIKETDPNYQRYVKEHGKVAVELDALPPAVLESEIKEALSRHLDMETMVGERLIQREEIKSIAKLRRNVIKTLEKSGVSL